MSRSEPEGGTQRKPTTGGEGPTGDPHRTHTDTPPQREVAGHCGRTVFGVLQSSFCAIWQIVATHVGFVLFGKISQIRVTFATIFYNSDNSLINFVLFRVISPIYVYIFLQFLQIAAKSLIDFVLFYEIAQTHLELMLFPKIVTNHTSLFVLFCKIA